METLQTRLQMLRAAYGVPVLDAEWISGISRSSINTWERGTRIPSADGLCQVAAAFGVSTDWLFGISDKVFTPESVCFAESAHNISYGSLIKTIKYTEKATPLRDNVLSTSLEAAYKYESLPLQARADIVVCCLYLQGYDKYFKANPKLNPTLQQKDRWRFFSEGLLSVLMNKKPISNYQQH